jgi:amidase
MSDKGPPLTDPLYLAARDFGVPYIRESLIAVFKENNLDVIVYPTSPRRPAKISDFIPPVAPGAAPAMNSPTSLANITGFPDLIVPAGFTTTGLPIGISFFGQAWSEPKILAIGYAYEQATHALRQPVNTPSLPGESFTY